MVIPIVILLAGVVVFSGASVPRSRPADPLYCPVRVPFCFFCFISYARSIPDTNHQVLFSYIFHSTTPVCVNASNMRRLKTKTHRSCDRKGEDHPTSPGQPALQVRVHRGYSQGDRVLGNPRKLARVQNAGGWVREGHDVRQ